MSDCVVSHCAEPADLASADAIARNQVYLSLIPFFLEAAGGDRGDAKAAAEAMIAGFSPASHQDFLLAAEAVVYGMAGLDSVRRSIENPDLPPNTHLRLRGNANAMQRASQHCIKALDTRRKAMEQAPPASVRASPSGAVPAGAENDESGPFILPKADVEAAVQRASAIVLQASQAVDQGARKPKYWEVRREAERQARLARRAEKAANAAVAAPPMGRPAMADGGAALSG